MSRCRNIDGGCQRGDVRDEEQIRGTVRAARQGLAEHRPRRRKDHRRDVGEGDDRAIGPRLQAAGREREEQVHPDREDERGDDRRERERERGIPVQQAGDVDEPERRRERADPVAGDAPPGDEPRHDPDGAFDHPARRRRDVFADELVREGGEERRRCDDGDRNQGQDRNGETGSHGARPASVARAAPVMSSLRMNPRAVVRLSRPPNSSAARLEVSTTIGG